MPFSYTLGLADEGGGLLDALGGMGGPADVGLLSRHPDALNLGHWFPIWVPDGNSVEPEPAGFGDIGNFPAALVRLDLTVPKQWTVVDGGVRVASKHVSDGEVRVVSEGYGMNDMVVSLLRGYRSKSVELDGDLAGVTVTAYAPADAATQLPGVLDETTAALVALSDALVAYPWREFDIVSAPLGSGVGGMEWPGATWIEPALFAGGIPGLGDLGSLGGLDGLDGSRRPARWGDRRRPGHAAPLDDRARGRARVVAHPGRQRLGARPRRRRAAGAVLRMPGAAGR